MEELTNSTHPCQKALIAAALQWHIDNGCEIPLENKPQDKTVITKKPTAAAKPKHKPTPPHAAPKAAAAPELGTAEAINAAKKLAASANTLAELKTAIQNFDGIALKITATNMVFADGNPETADIMLIGEAPEADEDREGKPFIGEAGKLLNKILAAADMPRDKIYISNILNWRPPGNRTPTPQELQISHPFIIRHIELAQPKIIISLGGTATKSLLNNQNSITKQRGKWQSLTINNTEIPTIATFHPSYLLKSPKHKRKAWQDALSLKTKAKSLNCFPFK